MAALGLFFSNFLPQNTLQARFSDSVANNEIKRCAAHAPPRLPRHRAGELLQLHFRQRLIPARYRRIRSRLAADRQAAEPGAGRHRTLRRASRRARRTPQSQPQSQPQSTPHAGRRRAVRRLPHISSVAEPGSEPAQLFYIPKLRLSSSDVPVQEW